MGERQNNHHFTVDEWVRNSSPAFSTSEITCRPTPAHGISMMRWSRGMLMEEWAMTGTPWPPYPPVPALIYTLATTQTEIAN